MLLSKENLTKHVCSKNPAQAHLQNLCITKRGVVSTDGHRLLVTPLPKEKGVEYPDLKGAPGFKPDSELNDGEKVLLPMTAAKKIAAQVEQNARLPIARVALDAEAARANGHIQLGVTNLETWTLNTVRKPDYEFPDYERVIPSEDRALFTTRLNADYVAELVKMVSSSKAKGVTLTVYANSPVEALDDAGFRAAVEDEAPTNPVRIAGTNEDGQEVFAILMPMRA